MNIFEEYAHYYDLLYQDRDYAAESNYVEKLIHNYRPGSHSILDLGCGTGSHDFLLADKGYQVMGIDQSKENIHIARSKLAAADIKASRLDFNMGDIRNLHLNQTYDVVIALFHVVSYQVTNDDLTAVLATVKYHLKPLGLFIFDCWYGPGVLNLRPAVRVKEVEDETSHVLRIAEPEMFPNENLVKVNYRILVKNKPTNAVTEIHETHCMRYVFKPEIDHLLSKTGFTPLHCAEWITDKNPGFDTWGIGFVAAHSEE
jgi:SAM-dependent methyltransferase